MLYTNQNGRITCQAHGGVSLRAAVEAGQTVPITTDLDVWHEWTLADEREFCREVGIDAGCESCRTTLGDEDYDGYYG